MIDINLLRVDKGGNPDKVRESQRKRGAEVSLVDDVINLKEDLIRLKFRLDEKNKEINVHQKLIAEGMKRKDSDVQSRIDAKQKLEKEREALKVIVEGKDEEIYHKLSRIGNIVHDDVVDSLDENDNNIIKYWPQEYNKTNTMPARLYHHEVLLSVNGCNFERGSKVAGNRAYFLLGDIVKLNQALINYGIDFLMQKNYIVIQTPFFMNKNIMAKTAQLEEFDTELFEVADGANRKYLIATSEQAICGYHYDERMDASTLPLKYGGYSTCFRREAGGHGKDTLGIFRVHQFEKIEQFIYCMAEDSPKMFNEMTETCEEFYKSLEIPYRIVGIVSGALNNAAGKKYDLEAWFPKSQAYRELVSCSNCTDYQSRSLEIYTGNGSDGRRVYPHLLNCTLVATERTVCCIAETYQTEDGIRIPSVLIKYMGGKTHIPYVTKPGLLQ